MKTVRVTERDLSSGMGRRQRQVLRDIADRGAWSRTPGNGLVGTISETERICNSLRHRGFLAIKEPDDSELPRYILTAAGYAWLLTDIAIDMVQCEIGSLAYKKVIERAGQLVALARLSNYGPVNGKGEWV